MQLENFSQMLRTTPESASYMTSLIRAHEPLCMHAYCCLCPSLTPLPYPPAAAARSPAPGWVCRQHQPEHKAASLPVHAAAADLLLPTPWRVPAGTRVSGHSDWQVREVQRSAPQHVPIQAGSHSMCVPVHISSGHALLLCLSCL